MLRILAIDDDESTCFAVERALKLNKKPYHIETEDTRISALNIIASFKPHLVIVDYFTVAFDMAVDEFVVEASKVHASKFAIFTGIKFDSVEELAGTDLERAAKMNVKIFLKTHNHLNDVKKILSILAANH